MTATATATALDEPFWRWRLGALLLMIAAATQVVGTHALGQPIDPFAVACFAVGGGLAVVRPGGGSR